MRNLYLLTTCILLLPASLRADGPTAPTFLKTGQDYLIHFAARSPFQKTVRIPVDSDQEKKRNSSKKRTTVTHSVDIFTVVALSGGSWILVEHPRSIEDASKWKAKRIAMASISPQSIAALQSTKDGKIRLERLRQEAAVEIETSRTWVNLDHMLTIRKPPTKP